MKENKRKNWYKTRWAYYLYLFLLVFPIGELATRIMGYAPYNNLPYTIYSKPSECLQADANYGLVLKPGKFVTTINRNLAYEVEHTTDGLRKTPKSNIDVQDSVFLFGCSFTYGMGVNDNETFTAILQSRFNNYNFFNFGVPGYGTVQSLLQLKHKINQGSRPSLVVLNFSKLHFDRNAMTPKYRRHLKIGFERSNKDNAKMLKTSRFPYVETSNPNQIKHVNWEDIYQSWKGRETFALINYLNIQSDHRIEKSIDEMKITLALFQEMSNLCKANNIRFSICFLDSGERTQRLINFCTSQNIEYTKVGLSHSNPDLTNLPHDSHPNKKGHLKIADQISLWLTK